MGAAASVARAEDARRRGRSARIVQRARLKPACSDDAPQMRFAVEDALRTADFADCGRLIVVRRLRLRALPPRAGPTLIGHALAEAWRALSMRAVSGGSTAAAAAPAVFFASRFAARAAWLERAATRGELAAWYWAAAVPEADLDASGSATPTALAAVVAEMLAESASRTLEVLRAWPDDSIIALAQRLPDAAHRRLEAAFAAPVRSGGAPAPDSEPAPPSGGRDAEARARVRAPFERVAVRNGSLPEAAAGWLAALGGHEASRDVPAPASTRILGREPSPASRHDSAEIRIVERSPARADRAPIAPAAARAAPDPGVVASASAARVAPGSAARQPAPAAPSWRLESGLPPIDRAARRQRAAARRATPSLPWLADALPTGHGGLLFLVNLLQALGFDRWLAEQPAAARAPFVDALLGDLLDAVGAPADDPQRSWFALDAPARAILTSTTFSERAARFGLARALRLWRVRLRRTLRRHAGIDLAGAVLRRAWVSATPTHIDAVFPLDAVDLRLRRLGLDADPGWLPWLGRIVAFHFIAAELLPGSDDEPAEHGHG